MNSVVLLGRLTRDPELKFTPDNTAVCSFTIAVDRGFKDKDGNRQADFPSLTCWRKTAEFVSKWFHKGDPIAVSGRLQTRKYDDQDGKTHYITEVVVSEAGFVPQKKQDGAEGTYQPAANPASSGGFVPTPDDDITLPFDLDP